MTTKPLTLQRIQELIDCAVNDFIESTLRPSEFNRALVERERDRIAKSFKDFYTTYYCDEVDRLDKRPLYADPDDFYRAMLQTLQNEYSTIVRLRA